MQRPLVLAIGCAVAIATPVVAAPYVVVDANKSYFAMLDEGSLVRSTNAVDGEALMVMNGGKAILVKLQFDCSGRTWRQKSSREVGPDLALSAVVVANGPMAAAQTGSLGASLLERACFGRQLNASGGWSRSTLGEALTAARAVLARENSQP